MGRDRRVGTPLRCSWRSAGSTQQVAPQGGLPLPRGEEGPAQAPGPKPESLEAEEGVAEEGDWGRSSLGWAWSVFWAH